MASSSTHPALSTSSSSSSSTHPQKYDVFLSFRGADTRFGFADTLYHAMRDKGIVVFRDEEDLELGEEINPALKRAITESKYAVVIISEHFANSKACLFELTVIMECRRMGRLTVVPIFYKVDASDVGNLTNNFGGHFAKLEDNPKVGKEQWEKWRSILLELGKSSVDPKLDENPSESCGRALKELTKLCGRHVKNSYETPVARKISEKILAELGSYSSSISETFVGIESQVQEIMKLLNTTDPVRLIGICGLPGIGKTILAEVIYHKVSSQFDGRCFIGRIGKTTKHKDLVNYQKKLISSILDSNLGWLKDDDFEVKEALRNRLKTRRGFIVLDDVWYDDQVNALAERLEWFGNGSKIIITSRNCNLPHLSQDNVYQVQPLNKKDALQLFCLKAFNHCEPKEGFEELATKITSQARCLPLALNTFGSYLSRKLNKVFWCSYLKELCTSLDDPVSKTLVESLKELAPKHRELVLEIACFFNGCLEGDFEHILEALDYNPINDLNVLKDNSFIRISNEGEWLMHDIVVEVGQKSDKKSRLFQLEDIAHELKTSIVIPKENPNIKGIVLQLPLPKEERFSLEALSAKVKLRVLQIGREYDWDDGNLKWDGALSNLKLSEELRIMEWEGYPLKSWPKDSNFAPTNLVELKLSSSKIKQLWVGKKSFPKLKHLQLHGLEKLTEIPNLSGIPNLEILDVFECKKLTTLHPSSRNLKLKELLIKDSINFQELPNEIISESLKVLSLQGCFRVEKCPNIPHSLQHLQSLCIGWTSIKELPFSSESLPSLKEFFAYPNHLKKLPSFILSSRKLKKLCVGGFRSDPRPSFQLPPSFSTLSSLEALTLTGPNMSGALNLSGLSLLQYLNLSYSNFTKIPDIVGQVPNLVSLNLSGCDKVKKLSKAQFSNFSNLRSLQILNLHCCNLKAIPESIGLFSSLSELDLGNNSFTKLPDSIWKLSKLEELHLRNCTSLESLPNLPLSLQILRLKNCPKLRGYERQMPKEISRQMLLESNHSFTIACAALDGKPYKVLYLHPKSPPYKSKKDYLIQLAVAYGPTLEPRIPDWFTHRSIGSCIKVQISMDWNSHDGMSKPWACALLIVYEVCGHDKRESKKRKLNELMNSVVGASEGKKSIFPEFVCQLQVNEVSLEHTFVVCVPKVAHVGLHGLWVCINIPNSSQELEFVKKWSCQVLITASSKNVVLKEGGARLLNRDAHLELAKGIIGLDSQSLALALNQHLTVIGPIKKKKKKKKMTTMMMVPFKNKIRF